MTQILAPGEHRLNGRERHTVGINGSNGVIVTAQPKSGIKILCSRAYMTDSIRLHFIAPFLDIKPT